MNPAANTTMGGQARAFPTTRWSIVAQLDEPGSARFQDGVSHLARQYWKPVYVFIRASWGKSNEEAKDLTQTFFSFLLEKNALKLAAKREGRFRRLLLTVLKHFLVDVHRRNGRQRRGGGMKGVDIDKIEPWMEDAASSAPDEAFDRAWAREVLSKSLERLKATLGRRNRSHQFEAFRLRYIELFQKKMEPRSLSEMAAQIGRSLSEFKNDLVAARAEFRDVVMDLLRETSDGEEDAEEELSHLLGVIG